MPRFDITRTNRAIEQLLEITREPAHRYMLQAFSHYRSLAIAGRYQEIFAPGVSVCAPTYHMQNGKGIASLRGRANLKNLHRKWAETNQSVFFIDAEEIVVADRFIASVAQVRQQVCGASLVGKECVCYLPYVVSERVIERSRVQRGFHVDEASMYVYKSVFQMIWLYGDRCKPVAGDLWEPDPENAELIRLDPGDVVTTTEAAKALSPLIKPLPTFEEAVLGLVPLETGQGAHRRNGRVRRTTHVARSQS
jgi:hypothetical protein